MDNYINMLGEGNRESQRREHPPLQDTITDPRAAARAACEDRTLPASAKDLTTASLQCGIRFSMTEI